VEKPSFSADGLAFLPAGPIPTVADPSPGKRASVSFPIRSREPSDLQTKSKEGLDGCDFLPPFFRMNKGTTPLGNSLGAIKLVEKRDSQKRAVLSQKNEISQQAAIRQDQLRKTTTDKATTLASDSPTRKSERGKKGSDRVREIH
jgi:hypothetical protein